MKKLLVLFLIGTFFSAFFLITQRNIKAQESANTTTNGKTLIQKFLTEGQQEKRIGAVAREVLEAKQAGISFERKELSKSDTQRSVEDAALREVLVDGIVFELDREAIKQMLKSETNYLTMRVPGDGGFPVELELVKVNIFTNDFSIETSAPSDPVVAKDLGVHYQGMVKGDPYSVAAISVLNNEIAGFFASEATGNNTIGRLGGDNPTDKQIVYKNNDLLIRQDKYCAVKEEQPMTLPSSILEEPEAPQATCVRLFLEANYDLFQNKGTVQATASYIAAFFNQSATIYRNDGVSISISDMYVWNSPSPYVNTTSSSAVLQQYRATRASNFNGTLAHLLTLANYGGIAYLNVICNPTSRHGVDGIDPTYQNLPTYSWTVDVFTHELGHNLGSSHTHACVWNGNNTTIDRCGPAGGYPNEGGCPDVAPLPAAGQGTIMSYCHINVGKNLALGFGDQPRAVIQNRVGAASCLIDCGSTTTIQFSAGTHVANETGGAATVFVTRPGGSGTASVSYATANGTAISPQDYTPVSGTLNFAAGETVKSISVPINDDFVFEGNETILVNLSSPSGSSTLGTPSSLTITVVDNDPNVPLARAPFDYDGDGKADVSVFRPSTGVWYVNNSGTGSNSINQFGLNNDMTVPADYDGDGKTDIAIWRPSNGTWFWINSNNGTVGGNQFGVSGDRPVPGDFDGDTKADITIYRPTGGLWWTIRSSTGAVTVQQFGNAEDKPNVADFDGDDISDLSVYRPSNGSWYRINSSNGGFVIVNFGISEDKPVPADYDGDGRSDVAVWRPSTGAWYWINSGTGAIGSNQFGVSGDLPVAADYDGDGRADLAVFRPSQAFWYLLRTTAGLGGFPYGATADIPTPTSFVQ